MTDEEFSLWVGEVSTEVEFCWIRPETISKLLRLGYERAEALHRAEIARLEAILDRHELKYG